ncbi:putative sulfate exporter family transporter [Stappia sp. F7233]|uniref:Putative sulfate exporter family transporter n=1 Tax=Stappia albiluteola TaxID=2758565 RepID=A0A839AA31_9HYPH|nr:putative sulfate exporter family transporter [Stappia albiluteola]MBA5776281.1 putative sulfate exporter family transporter [Stappia albiluteola]
MTTATAPADGLISRARLILPGAGTALLVAAAASFVADTYGGPVMLLALLIGIALNFLSEGDKVGAGIRFTSKTILKLGVALLGLRIAASDVLALGTGTVVELIAAMAITIFAGLLLSRAQKRTPAFGMLVGGATAICGASAALAISSALPDNGSKDRETVFTVVAVTTLSTIAMVVYPVIANLFGFDDRATGILLGATIHDVAQVVGAGYAVSEEAGDTATIVKLFRVAMLLPVVFLVSLAFRGEAAGAVKGKLPIPLFAIGFIAMVAVNSLGLMPDMLRAPLVDLSRWCLIAAVAAIGLTTSIPDMLKIGRSAVLTAVATTLVLLGAILTFLSLTIS